jgi:mannose-6-phosphate isomerase-like protein (cupin superfamily)
MTIDNTTLSRDEPAVTTSRAPPHRAAGTGAMYLGPGDGYRFPLTGADTAGAYFAPAAIVAPGGGPPPHIHRHHDETFHVLEDQCDILLGQQSITAGVGDFVTVPRGTLHRFHNQGTDATRTIPTLTPGRHRELLPGNAPADAGPDARHPRPRRRDHRPLRHGGAPPRHGVPPRRRSPRRDPLSRDAPHTTRPHRLKAAVACGRYRRSAVPRPRGDAG